MATTFSALGFSFEVTDETKKEVKLTDGHSATGSVTVPKTVEYNETEYTVTEISFRAFGHYWWYESLHKSAKITDVFIPKTIKSIGYEAFYYCENLTEIRGAQGVETIGCDAFALTSLKEVTIPSSLETIGKDAFSGCSSLEEVTIPSSLETIREGAFSGCSSLKEVTIPSGIKTIENSAFQNCTSLQEVSIPSTVEEIGERAFWNCTALKSVTIPSSVETIGKEAFAKYTKYSNDMALESVTICNDEGEVNIGTNAFANGIRPKYVGVKDVKPAAKKEPKVEKVATPKTEPKPVVEKKEEPKKVEVKAEPVKEVEKPAKPVQNVEASQDSDKILRLTSSFTVGDLTKIFNDRFGSVLRVYSGRTRQEDDVKLSALTSKSLDNEIVCNGNLTVGSFIERMDETFGIKVKVYTCDEWVAVIDDLTLVASGKVKKNAVKADMFAMIGQSAEPVKVEKPVVSNQKTATVLSNVAVSDSYLLQVVDEDNAVAYSLCSTVKEALRKASESVGFEYDTAWTTRQFATKLVKEFGDGTIGFVGDYAFLKDASGSFSAFLKCSDFNLALKSISQENGLPADSSLKTVIEKLELNIVPSNVVVEKTEVTSKTSVDEDKKEVVAVDRNYWENEYPKEFLDIADQLLDLINSVTLQKYELKYSREYIGLARNGQATLFTIFVPQKKCLVVKIKLSDSSKYQSLIDDNFEGGYSYTNGFYNVRVLTEDAEKKGGFFKKLLGRQSADIEKLKPMFVESEREYIK